MNSSYLGRLGNRRGWLCVVVVLMGAAFFLGSPALHGQALGWEGETGVFVTPLAYTASSETQKVHPVVAYHYFNAGPVIGDFHQISIEIGLGKRLEFGYTHQFHAFGSDPNLSPLWQNGFDSFNAKFIVIPENARKMKWVPATSVGFIARPNVRNVGNWVEQSGENPNTVGGKANADFYVVASKLVPTKLLPVVLSGGVRGTNAMLWGMGGNAPDWQARAFGAVAFVFKGPGRSTIILGSEAAQQPHHPLNFPTLNIPTTLTYCMRVVPTSKYKLNLDLGVAQVAGRVLPDVDLKARHQVGFQMSYGF